MENIIKGALCFNKETQEFYSKEYQKAIIVELTLTDINLIQTECQRAIEILQKGNFKELF